MKLSLRTQAAAPAIFADAQLRTRSFCFVHGPVPARRYSQRRASPAGEFFSHCDLSSMTDYRVPHLVY